MLNSLMNRLVLPLGLFACVSVASLLIFGIDVGRHITYNLFYFDIFSNPEKYNSSLLALMETHTIRSTFVTSTKFLHNPPIMVACAIAANTLVLFFSYKIARFFIINSRDALVFVIVLGLAASSPLRGTGGTELVFTSSTVASLCVIVSVYCFLSNYILFGSIFASVALLFHPLNSFSILFFFLPGYFVQRLVRNSLRLDSELFKFVPLLALLFYTYFLSTKLTLPFIEIEAVQWYQFMISIHADDVLLLWNIYFNNVFSVLIICLGVFLVIKNKERRDTLDVVLLVNVLLVLIVLCIEVVQLMGFNIVNSIEIMAPLQLRRGLWFVVAISLVQIYREICRYEDHLSKHILVGLFVLTVLTVCQITHQVTLVILILITSSMFTIKHGNWKLFFPMALLWLVLLWPTMSNVGVDQFIAEYRFWIFLVSLFSFYVIMRIVFKQLGNWLGIGILLSICIFHLISNATYRHDVLLASYQALIPSNFNQKVYLKQIVHSRLQNEDEFLQYDVLEKLNDYAGDREKSILFNAISLGYSAPILSERPLLFSRWDNNASITKESAGNYFLRLKDLGINNIYCDMKFGTENSCLDSIVDSRINELTKKELESVSKIYNLGFVVRTRHLVGCKLLYQNKKYFVYKI